MVFGVCVRFGETDLTAGTSSGLVGKGLSNSFAFVVSLNGVGADLQPISDVMAVYRVYRAFFYRRNYRITGWPLQILYGGTWQKLNLEGSVNVWRPGVLLTSLSNHDKERSRDMPFFYKEERSMVVPRWFYKIMVIEHCCAYNWQQVVLLLFQFAFILLITSARYLVLPYLVIALPGTRLRTIFTNVSSYRGRVGCIYYNTYDTHIDYYIHFAYLCMIHTNNQQVIRDPIVTIILSDLSKKTLRVDPVAVCTPIPYIASTLPLTRNSGRSWDKR